MVPVNFNKITLTLSAANQKYALSATKIIAQQFEIYITGTGPVYIGDDQVTTAWIPRASGSLTAFTSSSGGDVVSGPFFDLSKIYALSATAGDVVTIMYVRR